MTAARSMADTASLVEWLFSWTPAPGRCQCGCGQKTAIAWRTDKANGTVKGQPKRFVLNHHTAPPLRIRLLSQLIIDPSNPSGCLLWTGSKARTGYGQIKVDEANKRVHRVMYEMFVSPIPEGLELDHVKAWGCRHRHCASPAHLEPVTSLENNLRADGIIAAAVAATHCGTCGLPYDEANTYRTFDGRRNCRNCGREASRRYEERKKKNAA